ncbi:valyl-tRNA synthetase [Parabacteroides sp. PF5-5]|uniref:valine--tRNA ligase n=1 Tax=unclassified Parabacteroides TaxID=2649774 RepID=UPI002474ED00|nr:MULTISPECIES: valine--tRNA ligase [unclassified Parabacteroides]MDH6305713.1 valyl-tRNA synthetase [Parabacteroides sp. PH5-39]MDH6316785.1 valyl-tRNA synthetase [Parabacteroides sp. PF5-13]MDH6320426.1 valyl-tRNA synthetase [Parabacteroides sp. PH5-13]MDH6324156.1 valyl-tRNA synthetase [Parabacteroides sp. PH5-8]MDH6327971.1 valyl-tRNA synthetase [Parabacteroides sp. PH5-41]
MEIASKYNPAEVEEKWYQYWLANGFFSSVPDDREPYTIVIPPPNVTGVLHMGHMLNNTIQDILVRRARMQGKNACWVPGTDHASIATEAKVVAKLAAEGIGKKDLTREQFLEHAWEWTHKHGGIILEQLKKLGASCDWDRTCFTMDEARSKSVIKVFCDLYKKGLIYRGIRMVNWDPAAKTAISDEEVMHKEEHGKLYYVKYKVEGENGYAVIATTRPETIFGDVAVCIHPNDPKTAAFKGKKLIVPIANRVVPVIEDEYVDTEFGTGFLKVTPAHDVNDYMLGEKHNLEAIDIFNDNGTLNQYGLQYEGMDRFVVRKQIEKDLEELGLMEKTEAYTNSVGYSERTDVPIEPKLSMQWFLKMENLAKPALDAVENDTIKFHPAKFKNMYRHWMENIKDWNISRQLWWGHQIPAYYLPEGGFVVGETEEEALQLAREKTGNPNLQFSDLRQDEDCLDTWFSSWLWPISVFDGINHPDNEEINYYYPTNDLVTAPEIIFFWVARMIMSGYEYRQEECFRNVYFTGIVRDKLGRKMSKSLGNSPDPIELMNKYGADGVRMGMLLTSPAGNDLPFDESLCEQGRNFNNKIWNAFRLVKGWEVADNIPQPEASAIAVKWFRLQLDKTVAEMDDLYNKYRLNEALMLVYKLFWDEFSSWYLELIKPAFGQPIDKATYQTTLGFFDALLRLLHPFMPFITEELWQALDNRKEGESIMVSLMPQSQPVDNEYLNAFEMVKEIIGGIRTIRLQKNIPNKDSLDLQILGTHNDLFNPVIIKMCNLANVSNVEEKASGAVSFLVRTTEYAVPLGNKINVEEELKKLSEELNYQKGFLAAVMKKLGNESFVSKAPAKVIEMEQKKQADAESKIKSLEEAIATLKK